MKEYFVLMYLFKYTPTPVSIKTPITPSQKLGNDSRNNLKNLCASLSKTYGQINLKKK